MIYSNLKLSTQGRQGTILDYQFNPPKQEGESEEPLAGNASNSDPAIFLGEVNGRAYRYFPDDFDMSLVGEQDSEIDFRKEEQLSEDVRLSLRAQRTCLFQKEQARAKIELDVGDVLDIIADMGQLIEFSVIAASALCADKAGIVPMSKETTQDYGARGAAVLKAIADGNLMLRASFETPEKMITTIMPRYSKVQEIVRDRYINLLKKWGL